MRTDSAFGVRPARTERWRIYGRSRARTALLASVRPAGTAATSEQRSAEQRVDRVVVSSLSLQGGDRPHTVEADGLVQPLPAASAPRERTQRRPQTAGEQVTRVFVLDDQDFVRRGLKEMLEADGDVEVVGEAGTVEQARSSIPRTRPDVAVLDVRLPDGNGVEVCREVRSQHPEIQCVMLSAFEDDEVVTQSILAGASGYVLKQIRPSDIVNAVRLVATGEVLFAESL
jgi:CheY-like chemotaxis protein